MFQALQVHANMAGFDCLEWQDASGTQTNENQHRNAQRVNARKLFYIPYADLM